MSDRKEVIHIGDWAYTVPYQVADEIERLDKCLDQQLDVNEKLADEIERLQREDVAWRKFNGMAAKEIERLQKAYRPADMLEYQRVVAEIERLRAALERIAQKDAWANDCSEVGAIAREALNGE